MTLLTETRERFLLAITSKVPAERIAEIHFFQPIKQGGVESGVAVAAAWPEVVEPVVSVESLEAIEPVELVEPSDPADQIAAHNEDSEGPASVPPSRHVVYMARYRHTLKGIDRGKWETNVVAEADAPLVTVDAVVRGVQRRAGDVDDPTRMEGDEVREFVESRRSAKPVSANIRG
jgi:hypothetical protein